MDIIQLKCGHCQQVMAISAAHLGQQVHCPHCQGVVQTPPPSAPSPNPDLTEPGDFTAGPPPSERAAGSGPFLARTDSTVALDSVGTAAAVAAEPTPETDFTQFKPRRRADRSVFLLIALIFLVPYAVTITIFFAMLVMNKAAAPDPFEYLRDPVPEKGKGGPRPARAQPLHTLPIAAHRKTTLGQPVRAGDLLVTPNQVVLTSKGDLKLIMRVRNTSATTAFEPMHLLYVNDNLPVKPYTFLETRSKTADPIYGADLEYHKDPKAADPAFGFAVLAPREEVTVVLETHEKYRPNHVAPLAKTTDGEYTWRVQLRRGFVKVDNKDVSATTVIGVDFSSSEIEHEK